MIVPTSVKERNPSHALVGVIASASDLKRALRLRRPPEFFELRLDTLPPDVAATAAELLCQPLIVTARHPDEGGRNRLSTRQRRDLLLRFLPYAAFVDVELRSAKTLRSVLEAAADRAVKRIISVHELDRTPSLRELKNIVQRARTFSPDLVKIVTRTDRADELARLLDFFEQENNRHPLCAMGVGRLGRESRIALARRGSYLHYVHLGTRTVAGQLSIPEARRLRLTSGTR
ncbi:MAG: type I 3-dehydroquinate dehydratase [Chthoniobacterales bacterium]